MHGLTFDACATTLTIRLTGAGLKEIYNLIEQRRMAATRLQERFLRCDEARFHQGAELSPFSCVDSLWTSLPSNTCGGA